VVKTASAISACRQLKIMSDLLFKDVNHV